MNEKILNGQTLDIISENVLKLKTLFPEIVTEDKIDFEKLQAVLGEYIETDNERYNFTWNGKGRALRLAQTPSTGTLRPCKEESKEWNTTQNLYFEGDNLEVLKLLQKTYHGKIKMIYIDPPYNTGKDFVYPDYYKDNLVNYLRLTGQKNEDGSRISNNSETSGRYHTNWLNMMYPRLRLARNILRDDGVIFISIDDNEVNNLRKVCDEIFGSENFIGVFVINSSPSAIDYGHIAKMHEYALFYAKNSMETITKQLPEKNKDFKYIDEIGPFNLYPLYNGNVAFNPKTRPNLFYPFYLNPSNILENDFYEIGLEKKDGWIEVYPVVSKKDGIQRVWRWSKNKASQELNREIVGYRTEEGEFRIVQKTRHTGKVIRSLQIDKDISSRRGTGEVEKIFGTKLFSFPKPIELIKRFVNVSVEETSIVLDIFSGSATTAHAVMQLNAEDGGNRKFIMVQLPEPCGEDTEAYKVGYKNICEIGKERIRRAGEEIKTGIVEKQNGQMALDGETNTVDPSSLDIGFKVFKLDSSNLKKWNPDYDNLETTLDDMVSNYVEGRTEFDVVYEIMLKYGIDLTFPVEEYEFNGKKVYSIGFGALVICLDDDITPALADDIVKLKQELISETMRVVFKDNGFKNDAAKTNVKETLKQAGIDEFVTV
ncbi:MAG: site-specific DNA-methyltransferase [Desulfitobacterium hafniense]|nr:site-specific DNA-methyltransferase [Desulfitobacterium hafniense]